MSEENNKEKGLDYVYRPDFKYTGRNIYNQKLEAFEEFLLRDNDSESFKSKWNSEVFKKEAILNAEIGTGYGEFMIEYCQNHPEQHFVGMDFRFKRTFDLAKKLAKIENRNFRYLRARGERIEYIFSESELENLFYFFPDPWPKNRHHKKRLFQSPFLKAASHVLRPGGTLWVKTDHEGYYQWMLDELQKEHNFEVKLHTWDLRSEHPEHFLAQYVTKFEKIFLSQGTRIKALELVNKK